MIIATINDPTTQKSKRIRYSYFDSCWACCFLFWQHRLAEHKAMALMVIKLPNPISSKLFVTVVPFSSPTTIVSCCSNVKIINDPDARTNRHRRSTWLVWNPPKRIKRRAGLWVWLFSLKFLFLMERRSEFYVIRGVTFFSPSNEKLFLNVPASGSCSHCLGLIGQPSWR